MENEEMEYAVSEEKMTFVHELSLVDSKDRCFKIKVYKFGVSILFGRLFCQFGWVKALLIHLMEGPEDITTEEGDD